MHNEYWMQESNIRLDELDIQYLSLYAGNLPSDCKTLEILFENGFYKRLNLYLLDFSNVDDWNAITSLHGLDKLYLDSECAHNFVKTLVPQLKEFCIDFVGHEIDNILDVLVESFQNIERIHFGMAYFNSILPFICRSAKLEKIKIKSPKNDAPYCNEEVIDLQALNRERMKCTNAIKVTIYVSENVYVKTKEAFMWTEFS